MKTMKKIVAILAVALLLCSIIPVSVSAEDTQIVFNLGANGSATHADGTSKTTYTETVSGYTLTLSNVSNFYTGARDAKGNSCIKLGASSKAGGFSLTVPADVTSVIIAAGKYKSNTTKLSVNGTTHTLTKNSNDGAYDAITVDTTTNKTITLITVSGGYRAMINTITFVIAAAAGDCEHDWVSEQTKAPTCTDAGENTLICSKCSESKTETVNALGHSYGDAVETVAPDCVTEGEQESTCGRCGDVKTETILALGHNFVDGACDVCGEEEPATSEYTISFATANQRVSQDGNQQLWQNAALTFINNKAASTNAIVSNVNPVRLYANSEIIVECAGMTKIVFDCNSTSYATALKNSIGAAATVSGDKVTVVLDGEDSFTVAKLSAQVRLDSITVTVEKKAEPDCEHDYVGVETQAPTCSAEGVMTYTCSKCTESYTEAIAVIPHSYVEDIIDSTCTTTGTKTYECSVCFDSYNEVIPMKAHNYVDDVCADCGHVKAYKGTIDFSNAEQRTELTTQIQIWVNEGLTFTNNKLTGTNIADYTDPIRIYKNSGIVIEFPEMAKLIIDASGVGNDFLWDATLEAAGLSFTVENKIYTITFAEAVNSLELTCANQVRANSITAIVAHECVWADATCTAPKTCSKCGATEGEALGHTYFDDCSAICEVCGYEREVSHNIVHVEAVAPTCTAMGNIEFWYCDVCGMAWLDEACTLNTNMMAVKLPQAEHTYANKFDAVCNDCGASKETVTLTYVYTGKSISEDVNGLAFRFTANIEGLAIQAGKFYKADFTNAKLDGYKLLKVGVKASNAKATIDIEGKNVIIGEDGVASFAYRIVNILDTAKDQKITVVPYFIVEIDGVETTIYGDAVVGSYNEVAIG